MTTEVKAVTPKLFLTAKTQTFVPMWESIAESICHDTKGTPAEKESNFIRGESSNLVNSEAGGRACYDSWHTPNDATATTEGYIQNIIDQNHLTVLEHTSCSIMFKDVPRSLTHELVRHRHFSFSQQSQRYVYQLPRIVVPSAVYELGDDELRADIIRSAEKSYAVYEKTVEKLLGEGKKRKHAHEAARAVLPNCFTTNILVTGNLRSWIEFCQKRNSVHADADMRVVAGKAQKILEGFYPEVFKYPGTFGINTAEQKGPKK